MQIERLTLIVAFGKCFGAFGINKLPNKFEAKKVVSYRPKIFKSIPLRNVISRVMSMFSR